MMRMALRQTFLGTTRGTPVYIDKRAVEADKGYFNRWWLANASASAGFGGGRKSVGVGFAGVETIKHNYLLALED